MLGTDLYRRDRTGFDARGAPGKGRAVLFVARCLGQRSGGDAERSATRPPAVDHARRARPAAGKASLEVGDHIDQLAEDEATSEAFGGTAGRNGHLKRQMLQ